MQLLDGKHTAEEIRRELAEAVQERKRNGKKIPHLATILVGNDGGSLTYVGAKVKACDQIGFESTLIRYDDSVPEEILLAKVHALNEDKSIDGFIVQLPLPAHIDEMKITQAIDPKKDVDGFHPSNVGRLVQGLNTFIPATPYGVLLMFEHFKIETKGKRAVVIGRSNIVGRPMSILLSSDHPQGNCTVTCCHRYTPKEDLIEICSKADILVVAVGMPDFIDASMIKPGAVIIDVGITRVTDATAAKGFRIKGDVNYASAITVASAVTPVPGGVGLMTIAGLLKNTMKAYQGL